MAIRYKCHGNLEEQRKKYFRLFVDTNLENLAIYVTLVDSLTGKSNTAD